MNKCDQGRRQSNLELLRIVAMMFIVFLHANYTSLGKVGIEEIESAPISSFIRVLLEVLCVGGVNIFIFISGWFGIRPSFKGAMSLIFQVLFFTVFVLAIFVGIDQHIDPIELKDVLMFRNLYWFMQPYLILYILAPVLNSFIANSKMSTIISCLGAFFIAQFYFGWIGNSSEFGQGQSTLSFIGLYLLARFLKLYAHSYLPNSIGKNLLLYLGISFVPIVIFYLSTFMWNGQHFGMLSYASPFIILASIFIFRAFTLVEINSSKVNYVAGSIFVVYLLHMHPLLGHHFFDLMRWGYEYLGGGGYILFVLGFTLILGVISVLLDKVRICIWQWICKVFGDKLFDKVGEKFERISIPLE